MFKTKKIMFLYTETSIHPGAGDSTGVVDLPIQREVHTKFPIIQGSELKGSLREYFEKKKSKNDKEVLQVFGTPANPGGTGSGGALGFSMAKVVLFPLASLKGIFAYVTCPMCLEMLKLDLKKVDNSIVSNSGLDNIPVAPDEQTAIVPEGTDDTAIQDKIVLSEFVFTKEDDSDLNAIAKWLSERLPKGYDYFKGKLYKNNGERCSSNLVVVNDNMFRNLILLKTEVVSRNVLNDNGISENVWTEENLPSDTLLYSMMYAADPYEKSNGLKDANEVAGYLEKEQLSAFIIGGNQTVGRGWVSVTFI
jgi:CRISPR-associated protein Cmr4